MKYVGTTETFDPCFVPDWDKKLLEANIIISKELNLDMMKKLINNQKKIIFHHTITGFGGSKIEPGVKPYKFEIDMARKLFKLKFPVDHYVLRIDPIIPYGDLKIINLVLDEFIEMMKFTDFKLGNGNSVRCRISMIDMYKHVRDRFSESNLKPPFDNGFNAPGELFDRVAKVLENYSEYFKFECCAEPGFNLYDHIDQVGCVSYKDLSILGIDFSEYGYPGTPQRSTCSCLSKKQILGVKPGRCPHGCIYCYWKS